MEVEKGNSVVENVVLLFDSLRVDVAVGMKILRIRMIQKIKKITMPTTLNVKTFKRYKSIFTDRI